MTIAAWKTRLAADHVAELPVDRRRDGRGEQVRGDDPGEVVEPRRSPTIVGSAVETIVWSSAARNMPSISATKIIRRPARRAVGSLRRSRVPPGPRGARSSCARVSGGARQRRRGVGAQPVEHEAEVAAPELGRDRRRSPRSRGRRSRRASGCPRREVGAQRALLLRACRRSGDQRPHPRTQRLAPRRGRLAARHARP